MAEKTHYLTAEGKQKIEQELRYLREVRLPQVAASLKAAVEEGDLSENAGYSESKREQSFVVGRIQHLEAILANAQLLDEDVRADRVTLGSRVTIVEDGGAPETYQIVGVAEADPAAGRISYESPLGKALLGHRVGDVVEAMTPSGVLRIRILSLNLPS